MPVLQFSASPTYNPHLQLCPTTLLRASKCLRHKGYRPSKARDSHTSESWLSLDFSAASLQSLFLLELHTSPLHSGCPTGTPAAANNTRQLARTFCFPIAIARLTCLPGRLLSHWNASKFAVWWSNSLVDTVSCSCILLQTELLDDIQSYRASPQHSKTVLQLFVKILLIKNAARTTIFLIIK